MDWTDAKVAQLRELWGADHSTREIADRMGMSKSAVVGKAHRLNLPSRPSPIRRGGVAKPVPLSPQARRAAALAATAVALPAVAIQPSPAMALPAVAFQPPPERDVDGRGCQWIDGDVMLGATAFCNADLAPVYGKGPWCAHHMARVWVRPVDMRESPAPAYRGGARRGLFSSVLSFDGGAL